MHFADLIRLPIRYRAWRPYHLELVIGDVIRAGKGHTLDHRVHLDAVLDWLCRAQDVRAGRIDEGGVSAGWSFEDGWLPSYPETSGYIIETLLAAASILDRADLRSRAAQIVDWELGLQKPDGAFPGHFGEKESRPIVFNTGQIMHGMLAAYLEFDRSECLEAARRAGRWLLLQQDDDGCWRRSVHNGIPHTYNTRAAWALIRTGLVANEPTFIEGGARNLQWALTQETDSGWFANNGFTTGAVPFTHTIAYAIRGLLEGGLLLGTEVYLNSAQKAATALAAAQNVDGWLAGAYADNWSARARYCCLTGLAQMVIIWKRMSAELGVSTFDGAARRGIEYLKGKQRLTGQRDPGDGGIAGSFPIWGRYSRFEFPNWSAKFFADALMMDMAKIVIPSVDVPVSPERKEVGQIV